MTASEYRHKMARLLEEIINHHASAIANRAYGLQKSGVRILAEPKTSDNVKVMGLEPLPPISKPRFGL